MSVKRTPDVFYENLTDWPHPPQYLTDLPSVGRAAGALYRYR